MAVTQVLATGDGSTVLYPFTFPYIDETDINVSVDGTLLTTEYSLASPTVIQLDTAPASGKAIRIFRDTDADNPRATFFASSAIRANDLNVNTLQNLYLSQESVTAVGISDTTANTAKTTAEGAVTTANGAVTTANSANTKSDAAVSTANTASTNASAAVTTANTASTNATNAVNTANTASANATTAVNTANAATTTANGAVTTANAATTTANTASTNASAAVTTSNTANTTAGNAVTSANSAVNTANTANTTSGNAVTTANSAVTTANTANTNASAAVNTANAASAAVSNAVLFTLIANVAAIPGSPSNNDYIEIGNSTGIDSFSPLSGLPSGFVGAAGLTVRLRYDTPNTSWVFMNYFANDSEDRYFQKTSGNTNTTNIATNVTNIATNVTNIAARLPLAGGTLTGDLTIPDKIIHSGDTNTAIRFPAADTFAVETAGTERLRIDSSGRVGIGTDSPGSFSSGANTLVVGTESGNAGITINNGAADQIGSIFFAEGTGATAPGRIRYEHANNAMAFSTINSERMRIDSSGRLLVGTTTAANAVSYADNLVIGTTSGDNGMTIVSGTSDSGSINFSDGTGANETKGIIQYHHSSNNLTFYVNSSERLRILSDGTVVAGGLTATPGTVAAGSYIQHSANAGFFGNNGDAKFGSSANNPVLFQVNGSEKARIDTSGLVGIGTSSPAMRLDVKGTVSAGGGSDEDLQQWNIGSDNVKAEIKYVDASASRGMRFGTSTAHLLAFQTNNTERMQIDSSGHCKHYRNTTTTGVGLLQCNSDIGGTDRTQWYVLSNGDVQNRNGSYTTISSDERMKKDIVDAPSQWTDIKNIKMRKFRYKADGDDSQLQLGVIAQELEVVCPNLVTRKPATAEMSAESEGLIAEGEDILSWKQSIVHLKALKALQEAMERIETLEQRLSDAGIA